MAFSLGGIARTNYRGNVVGISAQRILDVLHFGSAGTICFARALNDTPKIFAICLSANALGAPIGLPLLGAAMALGGVLNARRVAETMAKKITPLNAGQGFVANMITAALVIGASNAGLPVSTTHVSTSAVFGIGPLVGQIAPVRNEIAHVREVDRDRLLRANVACADVLVMVQGRT